MGEYALAPSGAVMKIGTCESMYYLRAQDARKVRPLEGDVDPIRDAHALRFRFPFPDEDDTPLEMVGSGTYDRALVIPGLDLPGLDHGTVFLEHGQGAERVAATLPCPWGEHGAGEPWAPFVRTMRSARYALTAQGLRQGVLALVLSCTTCGALWSFPERDDAAPILDALHALGENDSTWAEIARRARAGYVPGYVSALGFRTTAGAR